MSTNPTFNITVRFDNSFPVDLRELHGELGSGKDFSTWAKKRLSQLSEGEDFLSLTQMGEQKNRGGHNRTDYDQNSRAKNAKMVLKGSFLEGIG